MKKVIFISSLILFIISLNINSEATLRSYGAGFLLIEQGAGATGMGAAKTADPGDDAIYYNPAGAANLGFSSRVDLNISHMFWIEDIFVDNIAVYMSFFGKSRLGLQATFLAMPKILSTSENAYGIYQESDDSSFGAFDMAIALSWAKEIWYLSIGATTKYVLRKVGDNYSHGMLFDIGTTFNRLLNGNLKLGYSLRNLGFLTKMNNDYDRAPTIMNLGVQYKILIKQRLRDVFNVALELEYLIGDVPSIKIGTEYIINSMIALRIGYKRKFKITNLGWEGISAGFGINIKRYKLEYSFQTFGRIDSKGGHQITLKIRF